MALIGELTGAIWCQQRCPEAHVSAVRYAYGITEHDTAVIGLTSRQSNQSGTHVRGCDVGPEVLPHGGVPVASGRPPLKPGRSRRAAWIYCSVQRRTHAVTDRN